MKITQTQFLHWMTIYHRNPVEKDIVLWEDWDKLVKNVFGIKRQPEFFAQCAYESAYFRRLEEDMNYTTASRIKAVFGDRVGDLKSCETLVKNPKLLAKKVYYHHRDLGNDSEGAESLYKKGWEVWDFRGQGFIQLTGYTNWKRFKDETSIDCFKDKKYFQKHPWAASAFYWVDKELDYALDMREMTRMINGGYNGLNDRQNIMQKMLSIMRRFQV